MACVEGDLSYVRRVVDATRERGVPLILGNALPKVASETDADLVTAHRSYNDALREIAASDSRVHVFDIYGVLATPEGALRKGYAVSPDDSHLSPAGCDAFSEAFFEFMEDDF